MIVVPTFLYNVLSLSNVRMSIKFIYLVIFKELIIFDRLKIMKVEEILLKTIDIFKYYSIND